jgi:hypothetical protein
MRYQPITLAARSKAWTVFARSNAGIVDSNPTQGMVVCVCIYSVFVLSGVQVAALWRADPPSKESYSFNFKLNIICALLSIYLSLYLPTYLWL